MQRLLDDRAVKFAYVEEGEVRFRHYFRRVWINASRLTDISNAGYNQTKSHLPLLASSKEQADGWS